MLRICDLGQHLFDDDVKISSTEELITRLNMPEQVACRECWGKLLEKTKSVDE